MPIVYVGPTCGRRGCPHPIYRRRLCGRCWRLARMFGKDPDLFAYEPLDGYRDERDAVELPWDSLEQEARARGRGIADVLAEPPSAATQ